MNWNRSLLLVISILLILLSMSFSIINRLINKINTFDHKAITEISKANYVIDDFNVFVIFTGIALGLLITGIILSVVLNE